MTNLNEIQEKIDLLKQEIETAKEAKNQYVEFAHKFNNNEYREQNADVIKAISSSIIELNQNIEDKNCELLALQNQLQDAYYELEK